VSREQILALVKARPFRPFWVHLESGRNLEIDNPLLVELSDDGLGLTIHRPDGGLHMIDLRHVVSLMVPAEGRKPE
jgi:hypothetical protein